MSAKAKFIRGAWGVYFNQHNARWNRAMKDADTARDVAKEANRLMAAGEDLRPPNKRTVKGALAAALASEDSGEDTFKEFGNHWLVTGQGDRKGTTNDFYSWALREHLYPALGKLKLTAITRPVCQKVIGDLRSVKSARTKKPLAHSTREGIHATLTAVLQAAVEARKMTHNPAFKMGKTLRNPDEVIEEIVPWTATEAARFLSYVKEHDAYRYPLFLVALRCGLRVGELVELRWEKDFRHRGKVHVQRAYSARKRRTIGVDEKGQHTFEAHANADHVTMPKGKRDRLVDWPSDVAAAVAAHKAVQLERAFKRGEKKVPALVFTGERDMDRVSSGHLGQRLLPVLCKAAKVPLISIHGLRHTFATVLISAGVEVEWVSRQLGHADVATTIRHYSHWIEDAARAKDRAERAAAAWEVK